MSLRFFENRIFRPGVIAPAGNGDAMSIPNVVKNMGINDNTLEFHELCYRIVLESISDGPDVGTWCLLDLLVALAVTDGVFDMGRDFCINRDCYDLPTWGYGSMGNTAEDWLSAYVDNDISWTDDDWEEHSEWYDDDDYVSDDTSRKRWADELMMQPAIICDFDGEYGEMPKEWLCVEG